MRYLALVSLLLIAASGNAGADVIARAGLSGSGDPSSVQFVQERRKSETITERVKRAWKDLVGYKFDVSCPVLIRSPVQPVPKPARTVGMRSQSAFPGIHSVTLRTPAASD
jgi:hypothetical protein